MTTGQDKYLMETQPTSWTTNFIRLRRRRSQSYASGGVVGSCTTVGLKLVAAESVLGEQATIAKRRAS